ncbi:hypothetical protein [Variovorax sp. J31P179]|uniref:hypothetical protein n=1 Tax=Variovorax sp. J31P179 TaxID=3053508 RepID=UPI002578D297|nr:hypothetical protein [Variovorax sp. J31P179]
MFFGVLSVLFSFGKGLVFFIPGLLLFGCKATYVPEFSALWRPFVTMEFGDLVMAVIHSPRFPFAAWQVVVCWYLLGVLISAGRSQAPVGLVPVSGTITT